MDRYFQIVKCFRDEDLRADRQPEFTQLDLEMSFPTQERYFRRDRKRDGARLRRGGHYRPKARSAAWNTRTRIRRYGSDKPDLRFGMELHDVTEHFRAGARNTAHRGNVQALAAPGAASFSRKQLDEIAEKAKSAGRARRVHDQSDRRRRYLAARKKSRRGSAEENRGSRRSAKPGDLIVAVTAKEQIPGTGCRSL